MKAYRVHAFREGKFWVLTITGPDGEEIGATQAYRLSEAETMVRDYIHLMLDLPEDAFDVEITPEVPGVSVLLQRARKKARDAEQAQLEAAKLQRQVVNDLLERGMSGADAAIVLGVSPQRISQLRKTAS